MTEVRGLCLASTAVLHTLAGVQLWLHRPTHQGLLTIVPSLLSMPNKERSTENIFPAADSLPELTECSVVKVPVGEPSLFSEEKCLSLHGTLLSEKRKIGTVSRHATVCAQQTGFDPDRAFARPSCRPLVPGRSAWFVILLVSSVAFV